MSDLLRETAAGNLIRLATGKRCLQYPEEIPGFKVPYPVPNDTSSGSAENSPSTAEPSATLSNGKENVQGEDTAERKMAPSASIRDDGGLERLARDSALQQTTSQVILPVKTKAGIILVDWYSTGRALHEYLILIIESDKPDR